MRRNMALMTQMECEVGQMAVSYKRLFKMLIDKDMKKKELEEKANFSPYTMGKLNRGENVNVEIIAKICTALGCEPNDIMEILPEVQNERNNENE